MTERLGQSGPITEILRPEVSTGAQNYAATLAVAVSIAGVVGASPGDQIVATPGSDPPALGLIIGQCVCAVAGTVIMTVANVTVGAINAETFTVDFAIRKPAGSA